MEMILRIGRAVIPSFIFKPLQPIYHRILAFLSAVFYRFPSRKIFVVGVTGTKGKSSVAELINAILEEVGYRTALANTIRFKIHDQSRSNRFKMTMPGRFFMQRFLRLAVSNECRYAIIEMTSEGVTMSRHKWIDLDALVFTNLSPEHIEAHGSFEKYVAAKLELKDALEVSKKKHKVSVANVDDERGELFLSLETATPYPYSLKDALPYTTTDRGILITVDGVSIHSPLLGLFNIYNLLAAIAFAKSQDIDMNVVKKALEKFALIKGRVEQIEEGQNFTVVVDYAHTPDSLEQLYQAFEKTHPTGKKICVLGNTGGGRDSWKRSKMGEIADTYGNYVILTNEDPYDESPLAIVEEMASGMSKHKPDIIMDRRLAIRKALERAHKNDVVLITGKGTDPFIMGARGSKIPWSDASVVRKELQTLLNKSDD